MNNCKCRRCGKKGKRYAVLNCIIICPDCFQKIKEGNEIKGFEDFKIKIKSFYGRESKEKSIETKKRKEMLRNLK